MMNRSSFRKQLVEGLNTLFGMTYKQHPEEWREIFAIDKSNKAFEEDVLMTGFGAAQTKDEGQGVAYDEAQEAWVARYNHETVALGFMLTEEAEEDNLYGSLGKKYAPALARSMQHTKEIKGAAVLNNGFSASFLGGDGVSLFSTAHPLVGGGTMANKLSTPADLSEASIEEAVQAIAEWTDDRGIPIAVQIKKLVIPAELQFVATRLLMSDYRPGTSDNDINAMRKLGSVGEGFAVNRRLVDPDAWFLITDAPEGLKHFVRVPIKTGMDGDFDSGNMRYKARERYSFGWSDWRGAFASEGA